MDRNERKKLVEAWVKFQYVDEESPWKEQLLWAQHKLWQLTEEQPRLAWELIVDILEKDSSDKIIQNLAAGPLEDLLGAHGDDFIERVEKEAERNEQFRVLLGGVWQNEMSDEVWARVQAAAGESW